MSLHTAHFLTSLCYPVVTSNTSPALSAALPKPFFGNVISGWSPAATQNTVALLKAQDLQVAKISETTTTFTMAHKMGLIQINLKSKTVVTEKTFTFNGNTPTPTVTDSRPVIVTASSKFDTFIPYVFDNARYYILKATGVSTNREIIFKALRTEKDYWEKTISDVGYGKYATCEVYSVREYEKFKGLFNYCETYSHFIVPFYGVYTMEIWGAEGGAYTGYNNRGGYGGHAKGTIALYYGDFIYVCVGGKGGNVRDDGAEFVQNSGFNGGGVPDYTTGHPDNTSGGGCTHIARQKGDDSKGQLKGLSAYSDYTITDVVLMVAGGGGGGDGATGGDGGGPTGGNGTAWSVGYEGAYGATHTDVGAPNAFEPSGQVPAGFGYGGRSTSTNSGGGGGGGWYGGGIANGAGGGGGGSGHIATSVTQIAHEQSTHTGNGYATITSD